MKSIGATIELVDAALQPGFLAAWQPDGKLMDTLHERALEEQ
ncbi:hypothetical protein AB0C59_08465 [Streptomyces sp. NPDC048664]